MRLRTHAPGKVNLSLFVGEPRADGYHPLVSVFQAVDVADVVTLEPAAGAGDEVVCPGVDGPNLAATALARFRQRTGYAGPSVRITIDKRVPVAAGMGGGSGDAAAALRLIAHAAELEAGIAVDASEPPPGAEPGTGTGGGPAGGDDRPAAAPWMVTPALLDLAPELGADVPFALHGGRALVTGIGEHVEPLPPGPPELLVIVPLAHELSTPVVYRRADELPSVRSPHALAAAEADLRAALRAGGAPPAVNDLEPAARALCPAIEDALLALAAAGAQTPIVSGSGPTAFGRFSDPATAAAAVARLQATFPDTVLARPASPALARVEDLA